MGAEPPVLAHCQHPAVLWPRLWGGAWHLREPPQLHQTHVAVYKYWSNMSAMNNLSWDILSLSFHLSSSLVLFPLKIYGQTSIFSLSHFRVCSYFQRKSGIFKRCLKCGREGEDQQYTHCQNGNTLQVISFGGNNRFWDFFLKADIICCRNFVSSMPILLLQSHLNISCCLVMTWIKIGIFTCWTTGSTHHILSGTRAAWKARSIHPQLTRRPALIDPDSGSFLEHLWIFSQGVHVSFSLFPSLSAPLDRDS